MFCGCDMKTITIQSQVHSNETHCTPVLFSLIKELNKREIQGNIDIFPCINKVGFLNYCFTHNGLYDPDNGQNWNRIDFEIIPLIVDLFRKHTQIIKNINDIYLIIESIDSNLFSSKYGNKRQNLNFANPLKSALKSQFFIDVHTPEFGVEHLYCNQVSEFVNSFRITPTIVDKSNTNTFRKFLLILFEELRIIENDIIKSFFSDREIVTLEIPSNTYITNEYINKWSNFLLNTLESNNFIKKSEDVKDNNNNCETIGVFDVSNLKYYYSDLDGIIILNKPVGSIVEENDLIMTIISIEGEKQYVRAVNNGLFLCFRDKKVTLLGEWIARILELK